MSKDHVSEYAAQCSYYTILSFIPFIILLITLIQYINVNQQTLFDAISKIIPSSMNEFVLGIVREVYSKSIGTISVSLVFTLWAVRPDSKSKKGADRPLGGGSTSRCICL